MKNTKYCFVWRTVGKSPLSDKIKFILKLFQYSNTHGSLKRKQRYLKFIISIYWTSKNLWLKCSVRFLFLMWIIRCIVMKLVIIFKVTVQNSQIFSLADILILSHFLLEHTALWLQLKSFSKWGIALWIGQNITYE